MNTEPTSRASSRLGSIILIAAAELIVIAFATLPPLLYNRAIDWSDVRLLWWLRYVYLHAAGLACWQWLPGRAGLLALVGFQLNCVGTVLPLDALLLDLEYGNLSEKSLQTYATSINTFNAAGGFIALAGLLLSLIAIVVGRPQSATEREALPQLTNLNRGRFTWLMVAAIVLSAIISAVLIFRATNAIVVRGNTEPDFEGRAKYVAILRMVDLTFYVVVSFIALTLALILGRCAIGNSDRKGVWSAGLLAVAGGLQHAILVGLPAVIAGIMAMRAARCPTERPFENDA